ncbi:N-acetylneuraminate synthase family protein [Leptospira kanakyensis]|uniref:N-acetylneuraminate synthase family protein n=1 Tax=Leptospira kanakyensis TaxID=2484968 RepID=UPI00223D40A6|nr:N-acetylneuraminate synthase family protein [Leptospira kanakyensis]MCW7482142.1 N-acetylneuraminate synthase family protein [Leptospira kanakyensis]
MEDKEIGGSQIFVIAEIGSNHCQDIKIAYETIDAAVAAGADAVKFQSIQIDKIYLNPSPQTIALHKQIDLPEEWHLPLQEYCKKKGIIFFSSPTYIEAVEILESINVPIYKLASAQVGTFPQIVEKVALTGKPVILSTGLVSYGELEKVVQIFKQAKNDNFIILHCNSIYPVSYDRVHLPIMKTYEQMFDCIVGFSDHTESIYGAVAAVGYGAKVIEKHFSLSRKLDSPDAPLSLEPIELKQMIEGIRAAEKMIEKDIRIQIQQEEAGFKKIIETKLVIGRDKNAGDLLKKEDFIFRRSLEGINCKDLDIVIGKKLVIDKKKYEILEFADLIIH